MPRHERRRKMQPHQILRPGAKKFREPQSLLRPKPPQDTTKLASFQHPENPREQEQGGNPESTETAEKETSREEGGGCPDLAAEGDALDVNGHDGAAGVSHPWRRPRSTPQAREIGWPGLLREARPLLSRLPINRLVRAFSLYPTFLACLGVAYKRRKGGRRSRRTASLSSASPSLSPLFSSSSLWGRRTFAALYFTSPTLYFPVIAVQPPGLL